MRTVGSVAEVQEFLSPARPESEIGLVPTMGALHAGHVALLEAARRECDVVVASIFVNPAQFAPEEDFEAYPRNPKQDELTAEEAGVDIVFVPTVEEMYPEGFQTWVDVEKLSRIVEGEFRPGHFQGVATVCLKLFNIVRPKRAYFGQKDAHQVAVVKRLVLDLNLDVEIRVVATVRDGDGLAVSSRNAYLSPDERLRALALPRALAAGAAAYREGRSPVEAARASMNGLEVDYIVESVDFDNQLLLEAAVRIGSTRLIDNVILEGDR
jgi:pantoate--beta-alanine ligase